MQEFIYLPIEGKESLQKDKKQQILNKLHKSWLWKTLKPIKRYNIEQYITATVSSTDYEIIYRSSNIIGP